MPACLTLWILTYEKELSDITTRFRQEALQFELSGYAPALNGM